MECDNAKLLSVAEGSTIIDGVDDLIGLLAPVKEVVLCGFSISGPLDVDIVEVGWEEVEGFCVDVETRADSETDTSGVASIEELDDEGGNSTGVEV